MIKDFRSRFGFHTTPFTCEIRPEDRFIHDIYEDPLKFLSRTLDKRMSASLTAPAGTGKTALLRALALRLPETRYRVHYIKVTDLSKRDMCREIAVAVGVEYSGTYPMLVRRLQERFSATLDTDGLRPVILLDEAHDLRPDVLSMLRILLNFNMDSRLVVSIVLAGQPTLARLLELSKFEDIARRLSYHATLRLLSREEIIRYLTHRCQIAGAPSCPIDTSAIDAIYEIGRGNLRVTDQLTLKALETAHDLNGDVMDANHVICARRKLWP